MMDKMVAVWVTSVPSSGYLEVRVEFVPTVPHCSLATLIGLCLKTKLDRYMTSILRQGMTFSFSERKLRS